MTVQPPPEPHPAAGPGPRPGMGRSSVPLLRAAAGNSGRCVSRLATACLALAICLTAAAADATATLDGVRAEANGEETRLVVALSAPVTFRVEAVPARPAAGVPPRLYLDLFDTRPGAIGRAAPQVSHGIVQRVRATARDATTTRLIIDAPGVRRYVAFATKDPFRVIVDLGGALPRARDTQPAVAAARPVAPTPMPRRRHKVVLDPGHGGKDPGAVGVGGVAEKDVTLAIARRLQKRLSAAGFDVVLTRTGDVFLPLSARTARANLERADLFVSIHANASENERLSGAETYYLNNTDDRATLRLAAMENGPAAAGDGAMPPDVSLILSDLIQNYKVQESVAFAEAVQGALVQTLRRRKTAVPDLGVKRGPFYVLVGAEMPCVLVEVAFLTHHREGRLLGRESFQETVAEGLAQGVRRFVDKIQVTENL